MRDVRLEERLALAGLLLLQSLLFLALPTLGSAHAWTALSSFSTEITADWLGSGGSGLDGYDGIPAGPLVWASVQVPWLAALGRIGLVQVLGGLTLALGATVASWLCARELLGARGALVAAALVALPPPNTWVHGHYGAYHVVPLLTAPLGFWLLTRRRGVGGHIAGIALIGSSVAWSFGAIAVAAPLVVGWSWTQVQRGRWKSAALAGVVGGLLAAAPLLYKLFLHEHYGGLLPEGADITRATKPFVLTLHQRMGWPKELLHMLFVRFPYGLHFGLHGLPLAGPAVAALLGGAWLVALRDRRLGPWLAVPPSVVLVGLVTGWFVFFPGDDVPFERDARHMVGMTHALALSAGAAFAFLETRGVVARAIAHAGVGLILLFCLVPRIGAAQIAWDEGARPDIRTPFRLESRYVSGFFRGPHFLSDPAAAARSCEGLDGLLTADCQRGVAMAIGFNSPSVDLLRDRCAALDEASDAEVGSWCWHGHGWGHAMRHWRQPGVASERCEAVQGAQAEEIAWCREGIGWGLSQDFADRPGALRDWIAAMPTAERKPVAAGAGIYAGMIARTQEHAARVCRRLVPEPQHARCVGATTRNEGFMAPLQ